MVSLYASVCLTCASVGVRQHFVSPRKGLWAFASVPQYTGSR